MARQTVPQLLRAALSGYLICYWFPGISHAQTGFTISTVEQNTLSGGATVLNQLACWDGSIPPGAAVNCGTSATTGVIGVVIGNAGSSGAANIVQYGPTSCLFDAFASTTGDYIVPSTTSPGKCHDAGSAYPTTFPVGTVLASASAGSVTTIYLFDLSTSPGAYSVTTSGASPGASGAIRLATGTAAASSGNSTSGAITMQSGNVGLSGTGTGTIGNVVLDTGASTGSVAAAPGQIQIGPVNAPGITLGNSNINTSTNVGIGGPNTSMVGDRLQLLLKSTYDYSGLELTYNNTLDGYASVDFFDMGTLAYDWSFGALAPNWSGEGLSGPKFFIQHFTTPTTSSFPFVIDGTGRIGIGAANPVALLDLSSSTLAGSPSGTAGVLLNLGPSTFTDNATAASATAPAAVLSAFQPPTLAAANTLVTTTNAYSVSVGGAPVAGTNETFTNGIALNVASNTLTHTTNGYGLQINAPTGATNDYSAVFQGGNVGVGTSAPQGALDVRQLTNGSTALLARRATDSSPSGYFLQLQNYAGTANVLAVGVNGVFTSPSYTGIPIVGSEVVIAYSGTVAFNATTATVQRLTLTGNVTSWSIGSGLAGQRMCVLIAQDSMGGRTFPTTPSSANVLGFFTISTNASARNSQCFYWDGVLTAWVPESAGITNF